MNARVFLLIIITLVSASAFAQNKPGASPAAAAPATRPTTVAEMEKMGWTLTFADEFEGSKLDTAKWNDMYPRSRTHGNGELQYYAPDGYEVKGGLLRLIGQQREMGGKKYTSGMVASWDKFSQQYGWFEIRAKFPKGKGYWPAFWLLPETKRWPPEIDVLEILGHDMNTVYFTTHWTGPDPKEPAKKKKQQDGHRWKGPDFSEDFHTFAADWQKGQIVWYVDGIERARTSKGVPDEPMYILANLAIGGNWPGNPDATTVFPRAMEVDWIRVYQRK